VETNNPNNCEDQQQNNIANYLDFGKKNFPELQAELDYYIEKTQSLEAEIKTMNLEILYHRTQKDDIDMLKENLQHTERQIELLHKENNSLQKEKEHYEKEYNIQVNQINKQEQRMNHMLEN